MKKIIYHDQKIPSKSPSFSKSVSLTYPKQQLWFDNESLLSRRWSQMHLGEKNYKQLETIKSFVEQISVNPDILNELSNYEELIYEIQQQNRIIQQEILRQKEKMQIQKKKNQQLFGNNNTSYIAVIKQSLKSVQQQIKRLEFNLNELKKHKQSIKDQKLIEQKRIIADIKQQEQKGKKQVKIIQNRIKVQLNRKKQNLKKLKSIQYNVSQLKLKWKQNKLKQQYVGNIAKQNSIKKEQLVLLKNKQKEELQKYKQFMKHKRNNQQQLKRVSQKKMFNFSMELQKKLKIGDASSFEKFIILHQVKKASTKRLSVTTDTKSQDNDQSQEENIEKQLEKELQQMEKENPTLKQNKNMNIKNIILANYKFEIDLKKEQKDSFEFQTKNAEYETKIKLLANQQEDINEFLASLKDKIIKIENQLSQSKVNGKLRK